MTIDQLIETRRLSGDKYIQAASAYLAAWVELAACDGAIPNGATPHGGPISGFNTLPDVQGHPEFLPPETRMAMVSPNSLAPAVDRRIVQLTRGLG